MKRIIKSATADGLTIQLDQSVKAAIKGIMGVDMLRGDLKWFLQDALSFGISKIKVTNPKLTPYYNGENRFDDFDLEVTLDTGFSRTTTTLIFTRYNPRSFVLCNVCDDSIPHRSGDGDCGNEVLERLAV